MVNFTSYWLLRRTLVYNVFEVLSDSVGDGFKREYLTLYPASTVSSLAWHVAFMKSFTWLVNKPWGVNKPTS